MASGPETVIFNTELVGGGAETQGANIALLVAPHIQSGDLVATNVVKVVKTAAQAAEFFGDGSTLHNAAKVGLQNITRLLMVGMDVTNVASEISGDAAPVEDSDDVGAAVLANLPAWVINSVTVDGTPFTVVYTHKPLASMAAPATGTILVNTETGEWKLPAGEGSSGAGAGVIFNYDYADTLSVYSAAENYAYEYIGFSDAPFSAETYGVWKDALAHAATAKKIVASALESAVAKADVLELVESIRDGRFTLVAADYAGDLTSAFISQRASRPVNATMKLQPAPRGISFVDTYKFDDYGGALGVGGGPAAGSFHHMGVNAVYRTRGGAYLFTDGRSVTATSAVDNFQDIRRVVRKLEVDLEDALIAARRGSDTAIPFTQSGIELVALTMGSILGVAKQDGLIDQVFITKPDIDDFDAANRSARLMDGFDIKVRLAPQTHVIALDISAEV